MNIPSEEELLEKLRKRSDLEPDADTFSKMEGRLYEKAKRLEAGRRVTRFSVQWVATAALLALLVWGYTTYQPLLPIGKETANQPVITHDPSRLSQNALATMERLYGMFPDLQQLEQKVIYAESERKYTVIFSKGDQLQARVELQADTGGLIWFLREAEADQSQKPDSTILTERAATFLKGLITSQFAHYKMEAVGEDSTVQFQRYANDIRVQDDYYSIRVNASGDIVDVQSGASTSTMPSLDPANLTPPSEAMDSMTASAGIPDQLKMVYSKERDNIKLYYTLAASGYVDAQTGKELQISSATPSALDVVPIKVVPEGKRLIVKTAEEAKQVMQQSFGIDMQDTVFTASNLSKEMLEEGEKEYAAELEDGKMIKLSTIDNRVIGFSVMNKMSKPSGTALVLSEEQAVEKAIQFLQTYISGQGTEVEMFYRMEKTSGLVGNQPLSQVVFYQSMDGIPLMGSESLVTVDRVSGAVVGYRDQRIEGEIGIPDKDHAISKENAARALLQKYPLRLVYVYPEANKGPVLAYAFENRKSIGYVDAETGIVN